ncbi:hypothetical protein [uncultured marine virus]|uniref:ATP-dependent helicase Rep n=1 Tax=uncultured marine virus TaxID=186617 RepID=S4TEM2_9VIRU|nr:hypothetical protein [uncultured marine virus]
MARSRNWVFTLNNFEDNQEPTVWKAKVDYCTWQHEIGESGTPHLQGYLELGTVQRLSAMKKLNSVAHWEPRRGSQEQAIEYSNKEETREAGPWSYGEKKEQGKRNDLEKMSRDIVDNKRKFNEVAMEYPHMVVKYSKGIDRLIAACQESYAHDNVRGLWYYGEPGTGKSRKAYEENPEAYRKAQNKWFDGYQGEKTIILDDLDKGGACLGHYLKIWGDRYPCSGEIKGGTVCLNHTSIIVTSNYSIQELWPEDTQMASAIKRRFKCVHFGSITMKEKEPIANLQNQRNNRI